MTVEDNRVAVVDRAVDKAEGNTRNADQTISLDPTTTAKLGAWRQVQDSERNFFGTAYASADFVFTQQDSRPLHPDNIRQRFDRLAVATTQPRIAFHDLRRSCATGTLRAGVNTKVISERVGVANVDFFLERYAHLLANDHRDAAKQAAEFSLGDAWDSGSDDRSAISNLDYYNLEVILTTTTWDVALLDEVESCFSALDNDEMTAATGAIDLLKIDGPALDRVKGPKFHSMKELRQAIPLPGGDKGWAVKKLVCQKHSDRRYADRLAGGERDGTPLA